MEERTIVPDSTPPKDIQLCGLKSSNLETLDQSAYNNAMRCDTSRGDVSQSAIAYHYLTFSTILPEPHWLSPDVPAPPDLNPYTDPFTWSRSRKNLFVLLSCLATIAAAWSPGSYAYAVDQMSEEWHKSDIALLAGLTTFTAGFGVAPMVLAPFSEINGRRPVFLITGFMFFIFNIASAATPTFSGMLITRFLCGCFASTFSTMTGGVMADVFVTEHRNTPMTLYTGSAIFGLGFAPLVSSFIAQHANWRWIFWLQAITVGTLIVAMAIYFSESRGSILLSRKAKALNKWYEACEQAGFYGFSLPLEEPQEGEAVPQVQRIRWKVKADEERTSLRTMIAISCYRPLHLFFTEPVVFSFSLWIAFAWATLFMMFDIVPVAFQTVYGLTTEQSGSVFAAVSIAGILATFVSIYQDRLIRRRGKLSSSPEARLYFCCIESALLPIGIFIFGWTARQDVPWPVPAIAVGLATVGIFSVYLAVYNYIADCYGPYASSGIAAQGCFRNLLAGSFPLFSRQMFQRLGYGLGGAASLLGAVGVALTVVPWVLAFYGRKIRARSKIASLILAQEGLE